MNLKWVVIVRVILFDSILQLQNKKIRKKISMNKRKKKKKQTRTTTTIINYGKIYKFSLITCYCENLNRNEEHFTEDIYVYRITPFFVFAVHLSRTETF